MIVKGISIDVGVVFFVFALTGILWIGLGRIDLADIRAIIRTIFLPAYVIGTTGAVLGDVFRVMGGFAGIPIIGIVAHYDAIGGSGFYDGVFWTGPYSVFGFAIAFTMCFAYAARKQKLVRS